MHTYYKRYYVPIKSVIDIQLPMAKYSAYSNKREEAYQAHSHNGRID